ncbi:inorganic phosphate transporter [Merismopedia glauca]|uniref:Phosphate transporter n=1 Tax=Merismopedia glauca CCAP 1448/3 TaxID=1296344 RepID=A0A2T1C138_9CYAN|nr:inorganic phosphate transporter [Merismopedia glauca]PSB01843.1 inorganic phosphate transporter [Merismopedia glauca CCAP 1448/3]
MQIFLVAIFTLFLAYANGANDNFKGVATLFGTKTTNYKVAIWWATITTFAGSGCSIFLAATLLKKFSGKGLVPEVIGNTTEFHLAVAIAASLTVILATFMGFPISTTHSLIGALVGAAIIAVGTQVNLGVLGNSFFLPLLLSPVIAITLGIGMYGLFKYLRVRLGIEKQWCLCVGETQTVIPNFQLSQAGSLETVSISDISIDRVQNCQQKYVGEFWGIDTQRLLNISHFLSAGVVSFARGLNDTPKIVSLMLITSSLSPELGMFLVAVAMSIGGLINARKVAETMSQKIAELKEGQGFTANLVTGVLVIAASLYGLPVSTTHVSVGAIFGSGLVSKTANIQVFSQIVLAWLITLPTAAIMSAIVYLVLPH